MTAPRSRCRRLFPAWIATLLVMSAASLGHAQAPSAADEARARTLYEEGTKRLDAGDLKEACPRLEEAVRLVPDASGAHLALGVCFERSGRLASALVHFEQAAAFSGPIPERKQRAEASAAEVRPRVPRLLVEVAAGAPPGAKVRIAGRTAAWGEPVLLDAGSHLVELVDGERTIARASAVVRDGEVTRLSLGPTEGGSPPLQPGVGSPSDEASPKDGGPPWATIGAVAIGVGSAGLLLGAIGGGVAAERDAASADACDERDFCNEEGFAARDAAFTWATVSTVGLLVGGALATTGIVLVIVDGSEAAGASAARRSPAPRASARVGPGGLSIQGAF